MNVYESDILKIINENGFENQRTISELSGHSLGMVNKSIRNLIAGGYLSDDHRITPKARKLFKATKPERAVILAAGFGLRMIPINMETPKAFLNVKGELLIERLINQLHEAGVKEIYIVVGFLKEQFEYLIDKYNVKLIVNMEYKEKGNLYSLLCAERYIGNTYILPCDIWCRTNPFSKNELYSWYMVSEHIDNQSEVRVNRKSEIVKKMKSEDGNTMIGISYITKPDADKLINRMNELKDEYIYDGSFWEEALFQKERMYVNARIAAEDDAIEINTYEQLRVIDGYSENIRSDSLSAVAEALSVTPDEITDIEAVKKGMTNRSFSFMCRDRKYIMRIPVEESCPVVDRKKEKAVYESLAGSTFSENVIYINKDNGYKISEYIKAERHCNAQDEKDMLMCMNALKKFHNSGIKTDYECDLFKRAEFYESLRKGRTSLYRDYDDTKKKVFSLRTYIEEHAAEKVLAHLDTAPENFLIMRDEDGNEKVRLIDWEYARVHDPHADIALFAISALYDKKMVDCLIDMYFNNSCSTSTRAKIYCYISVCGLMWSNWCEYKQQNGVEFGEYSMKQYRYAKEYYRYAEEMINSI